jgi:hypothetical protein
MSPLGIIILVILIIVLLGGIGPHFYQGVPWRSGYGYGTGGIGVIGIILIIVVILLLSGRMNF